MGAGLQKQLIPLFVGGGIDTKTDPRLAGVSANAAGASTPNGALLELENLYMQRTGELRWRNGFSATSLSTLLGAGQKILSLFKGPAGLVGALVRYTSAIAPVPSVQPAFFSVPLTGLSAGAVTTSAGNRFPFPGFTVVSKQLSASTSSDSPSMVNSDIAVANGWIMTAWSHSDQSGLGTNIANRVEFSVMNSNGESLSGALSGPQTMGFTPFAGAYPRCVAGGTRYLVCVAQDSSGGIVPRAAVIDTVAATVTNNLTINAIFNPGPSINPMAMTPKPGSNNIIFAARVAGVNVGVCEWNPATGTSVSAVTIGADAVSGFVAFLDNQTGDGNYYLLTGGTTAGVVCRTLNSSLTVTNTLVIDSSTATGKTNLLNATGYVDSGGSNTYAVTWGQLSIPATQDQLNYRTISVGVVVGNSFSTGILVGKCFKFPGSSEYYFLLGYPSSTQPSTFIGMFPPVSSGLQATFFLASQFQQGTAWSSSIPQNNIASVVALGNDVIAALVKQARISTTGGFSYVSCVPVLFTIKAPYGVFSPCEIGGGYFLPGSPLFHVSSPTTLDWAEFQLAPESFSLLQNVGGSMTLLGTYQYCFVFTWTRPDGSIVRSAPSVPTSITLSGANNAVIPQSTLWASALDIAYATKPSFREVYRAGPAAAGNVTFNKVLNIPNNVSTPLDTLSDAVAAAGEILYTTGGVLENYPAPPCNLMTSNNGRAFVVNSENPTELWFSKQRKVGEGVYFHPLLRLNITGDGYGAITALSAMDGRVIAFKSNAIYVISGDGPDDTGGGSFNPPQAITLNIGTTNPASVVTVPDGIMFEAAAGIYLLDRGLSLTYLGAPVEQYTNAENVVGASIADGYTQVRFVMPSGRCLVWDYHHKRWYTWKLRVDTSGVASTVVGCAQIQGGVWCYALADGSIFQETPGVFSDVNGTTTAIVPRVGFPQVNTGGINGFQRVYCMQIEGEYVGDHTLQVSAVYDLGAATETTRALAITAGPYQYEVFFSNPKCSTIQINLTASLAAGSGGFRLSAASLLVGVKRGSQFASTKRLT